MFIYFTKQESQDTLEIPDEPPCYVCFCIVKSKFLAEIFIICSVLFYFAFAHLWALLVLPCNKGWTPWTCVWLSLLLLLTTLMEIEMMPGVVCCKGIALCLGVKGMWEIWWSVCRLSRFCCFCCLSSFTWVFIHRGFLQHPTSDWLCIVNQWTSSHTLEIRSAEFTAGVVSWAIKLISAFD